METHQAWVRFLRTVAVAANQLAAELSDSAHGTASQEGHITVELGPEALVGGSRQRQIVAVEGLRGERGMRTAEIAAAINYNDVPNVYLAMRALEKRGLVELASQQPQRWRLVARFRETRAA
jgi:hypothetical protein